MLKLLALLVLIWIFFRALGMIIRTVIGGNKDNKRTRYSNFNNPKPEGEINVDHNPNKTNKGYDGGEYVDYEDVD
jgi:hypothetical protein